MAEAHRRIQERVSGIPVGRGMPDARNILRQAPYEYRGRDTLEDPAVIAARVKAEVLRRMKVRVLDGRTTAATKTEAGHE